jgi:hypothetical protein
MALPVTMTRFLLLARHVAQRQTFAAVRRPCQNHTTATGKPEHRVKRWKRTERAARSCRATRQGLASECCLYGRRTVFNGTIGPSVTASLLPFLVTDVWTCEGGTRWGNRNSGAPFPLLDPRACAPRTRRARLVRENERSCSCQPATSEPDPAALCAAGIGVRQLSQPSRATAGA